MLRSHLHRSRSPYLERIARHPLFAAVPRHLVPALGRSLEDVALPAAARAGCRYGDVLLVVGGHGVITRGGEPVIAVRDGAVVDTGRLGSPCDDIALVATAPFQCWLVPRREVDAVRRIAAAFDAALAAPSATARPGAQQRLPAGAVPRRSQLLTDEVVVESLDAESRDDESCPSW